MADDSDCDDFFDEEEYEGGRGCAYPPEVITEMARQMAMKVDREMIASLISQVPEYVPGTKWGYHGAQWKAEAMNNNKTPAKSANGTDVTFTKWEPFNLTPQDNWIFGNRDCGISEEAMKVGDKVKLDENRGQILGGRNAPVEFSGVPVGGTPGSHAFETCYGNPNPPTVTIDKAKSCKSEWSYVPQDDLKSIYGDSQDFKHFLDIWQAGLRDAEPMTVKAPQNFGKSGTFNVEHFRVDKPEVPSLPEKAWHNELVRLCDQSAKGITVHVASEAQLDSVRETAKRLRRPDIVFQVAPNTQKSDEKGG